MNRPRIAYGAGPTVLLLTLPCSRWDPEDRPIGGIDETASGVPVGYLIRTEPLLHLTLRFTEAEWPSIVAWIRAVITGAAFTFRLDQNDALTEATYYLEAPSLKGGDVRPTRNASFPLVYELAITLRRTTDTVLDFRFGG